MVKLNMPHLSIPTGAVGFGLASGAVSGVALFLGIADIGFRRIWDEVLGVGVGLPAIILVHLGQVALCALAWSSVLNGARQWRNPALGYLFLLRWVRESIDSLLPVAQIGGELAAARLLARSGLPLPTAGASIIADVTIETLTQAIFTLVGLAVLLTLVGPGDVARWAAFGLCIAVLFAALAILAQRWGGVRLFEKLLLTIAERTGWNKLEGVAGLDQALSQVYELRGKLFLAGANHLMAWSLGAAEIMVAAWALGHQLDFGQSYVIESLAQAIRSAAFFVPGALGVQEGGIVVLGGLFGVPVDVAISISLTKRVRELALGLPGLVAWQAQELGLRRARRVAAAVNPETPDVSTFQ